MQPYSQSRLEKESRSLTGWTPLAWKSVFLQSLRHTCKAGGVEAGGTEEEESWNYSQKYHCFNLELKWTKSVTLRDFYVLWSKTCCRGVGSPTVDRPSNSGWGGGTGFLWRTEQNNSSHAVDADLSKLLRTNFKKKKTIMSSFSVTFTPFIHAHASTVW